MQPARGGTRSEREACCSGAQRERGHASLHKHNQARQRVGGSAEGRVRWRIRLGDGKVQRKLRGGSSRKAKESSEIHLLKIKTIRIPGNTSLLAKIRGSGSYCQVRQACCSLWGPAAGSGVLLLVLGSCPLCRPLLVLGSRQPCHSLSGPSAPLLSLESHQPSHSHWGPAPHPRSLWGPAYLLPTLGSHCSLGSPS